MPNAIVRRIVVVAAIAAAAAGAPAAGGRAGIRRYFARDVKTDHGTDGEAGFGRPLAIAHDAEAVYVVDAEAHEIRVFTKTGAFLRVLGRRGQGPGEFHSPADVDVRDGRLYVADKLNNRVQVLGPAGEPVGGFRVPFSPDQICALGGGRVVLAHLPAGASGAEPMVHCYSGDGRLLWERMPARTTEDMTYDAFRNLLVMGRSGGDELSVVRKSDEDAVRRFDGAGRTLAPVAVPRGYPVRKVVLPLHGPKKVLEALCWDAAFDAGRTGLLAPGRSDEGDVGPGNRIFLLGPGEGAVVLVELPARVRRFDLDGVRIYAVDEDNDLRVFLMEPRR